MNTTLGKQILAVFFVPVVVIFIAISVGIYSAVSRYVNERVQLELRSVTEINATELSGQINNVKTAAVSMAQIIEDFDYSAENSREILTRMLQSLFTHEKIYNVRLAFEPQAFDERDGRHRRDYVGAPSGRFMRSFALYGGEIIVADDLDEEFIDDKNFAGWYVTPRDSENIYISVNSERANIIFDRFGEPIYVITVAVPIFREETVIGVVSVDMSVDALNINISNYYHAAQKSTVALFYSGGRIFYSPRANLSDSSVNSLGFSNTSAIWRTFRNRTALLIPEEHCPFSRMSSFILFQPVNIAGYDDGLFMYVSLPRSVYYENLRPAVILILFANAVIFTLLLFILMYAVRKVSRPINQLNRAATAIAQGNIEVAIEYSPNAQNEIGLLSKSLHTMVEKFRLNAMEMEQAQMESTIKSQIVYYITASGDKNTIFKGLASVFCKYFQIHKTTIVYVDSKRDTAFTNDTPPYEFSAHEKIEALLANRKILFLNTQTILSQKIKFLNEKTTSVCLIPLKKEKLLGYVIFENDASGSFSAGTEAIMIYISVILSKWLATKEWDEKEISEPEENKISDTPAAPETVLEKLKKINELDVDSALARMGGLEDAYEKTVRLLARLLPDTMAKMDSFMADINLKSFTIEIHGLKGVLRNIGAASLGNDAANLEKNAVAENFDFCEENYPPLRDLLAEFSKRLNNALAEDENIVKETLDVDTLKTALAEAKTASEEYDATLATEKLQPLAGFSYNPEIDELLQQVIFALEEFDCEAALENISKIEEKI